jgi:tetratricopeptide (TPR) repeat protein
MVLGAASGVLLAPSFAHYVPYFPAIGGYTPMYGNYYSGGYSGYTSPGYSGVGETNSRTEIPRERSVTLPRSRQDAAKAERLIARGDESFAKGSYTVAIARYREAAQVAPDAFDARLRHALALVAARKYAAAARVFFEAADLRSDWAGMHVNLERLYGPLRLTAATAALVQSADRDASNGELALSAGLQLYFSGQQQAAARYFQRATQLGADKYNRLADVLKHAQKQPGE